MHYSLYQAITSAHYKMFKNRSGPFRRIPKTVVREHNKDSFMARHCAFSLAYQNTIKKDTTGNLIASEWLLNTLGNPTVFIDSIDLLDGLSESKFNISSDSVVLPNRHPLSYFAFPQSSFVRGVELHGCFFGTGLTEEHMQSLRGLCEAHNIKADLGDFSDLTKDSFFIGISIKGRVVGKSMKKATLAALINDWNTTEFRYNNEHLSAEEHAYLQSSFHLWICSLVCIYAQAFPQNIKRGFPESIRMDERDIKKNAHKTVTITFPHSENGASPRIHLRRGHFRSLGHERFKHNDDGSPRVVFVKNSIIGGSIDPTTVYASNAK